MYSFNFKKTIKPFSRVTVPFCISTGSVCILARIWCYHVKRCLIVALIYISLLANDVEHLFMYLSVIRIFSIEGLFQCFVCHLKILGLSVFSLLSLEKFFVYSEYKPFVRYVICRYFLPFCGLSLNLFHMRLCRTKVFSLLTFFFYWSCFWWFANISLPKSKSQKDFRPSFFPKSFICVHFTLRSRIHSDFCLTCEV